MKDLAIRGIGVCAPGLPDWNCASRVLSGRAAFEPASTIDGPVDSLPPTERRRINETSRLGCLAAADALATLTVGAASEIPAIFTSSDGDGVVLSQLLKTLARSDIVISPTAFHNSVYNAPAGYWTIASRSAAPTTTICADHASFAVALLEAYVQAVVRRGLVLIVAVDAPFPQVVRPLGASSEAFACALVLDGGSLAEGLRIGGWVTRRRAPMHRDDHIASVYAGNAAAAALPLLRSLAKVEPARVELPYLDGTTLELEVTSC